MNQAIVPHYQNKPEQQLALLNITHNYGYDLRIDTMSVDRLEKFYFYTKTPGTKTFDKFLKSQIQTNDSALIELIGTKYMRIAQWDKAIQWLCHLCQVGHEGWPVVLLQIDVHRVVATPG